MPILFEHEYGPKKVTLGLFGTGDIAMAPAVFPVNTLCLYQDVEKPVEEWVPDLTYRYNNVRKSELINENMIVLEFGRVESIDVLISNLLEVRKNMIENTDVQSITWDGDNEVEIEMFIGDELKYGDDPSHVGNVDDLILPDGQVVEIGWRIIKGFGSELKIVKE